MTFPRDACFTGEAQTSEWGKKDHRPTSQPVNRTRRAISFF